MLLIPMSGRDAVRRRRRLTSSFVRLKDIIGGITRMCRLRPDLGGLRVIAAAPAGSGPVRSNGAGLWRPRPTEGVECLIQCAQ